MNTCLEIISTCISCDLCRVICPDNAVIIGPNGFAIENYACTLCGLCVEICPADCIKEAKSIALDDLS